MNNQRENFVISEINLCQPNPCLFGGICNENDGSCTCTGGRTGSVCQVPAGTEFSDKFDFHVFFVHPLPSNLLAVYFVYVEYCLLGTFIEHAGLQNL